MVKQIAHALPSEKGKLALAAFYFLATVKDIVCEEEYFKHTSKNCFPF